jgi:hypothetical protein
MAPVHRTLCLLTIAALLFAAGCDKKGDDGKAAAPPPSAPAPAPSAPPTGGSMMGKPVDACSMLTKADAEAATGEKLRDPERTGSGCTLPDGDGVKIVILEVQSLKDPSTAKQMFDARRANNDDAEPAAGVGDAAYWDEFMGAQRVHVLKGSYLVMLQIGLIRPDGKVKEPERKAATALIPKVLGKLP